MQFDFTLTPNGAQQIDVRGKFFKYISGAGKIRVRTSTGDSIDLLPGQGVWNTDYTSLTVQDRSGIANYGLLLAGDFDFHDDRISGSVEVIDGGRSRTLANQAFEGSTYAPVVAGKYATVQLWNPAGSGKRLVLKRVTGSCNTSAPVGIKLTQTQMATLDGNTPSKLAGGAQSTAQLRYDSVAALPTEKAFAGIGVTAGVSVDRVYQEPILILPGWGLMLWSNGLGYDCVGAFEFYEELQ
ncbi:MAG: hypothetical protein ACXU9C_01610 [Xanthobacteraceae bacterium]